MPTSVLQLGPRHPHLDRALAAAAADGAFAVVHLADQPHADAFLAADGAMFEVVVTTAVAGLDAATIARLPNLRAVASFGVGYDAIDLAATAAAGVVVSNTPGVLDDCVADTAIALMIDVARRFSAADRYVRRGEWARGPYRLGARFSGRRLGIVGLGHIGRAIAKRAAAFDMDIRYMQRREDVDAPYAFEPDLVALARWADFLAVAVAGGESTRGLISRDVLDALGPDGFVVNVARGSVLDEAALVEALRDGRLGGAGLDVYVDEPRVPAELLDRDDVVLLPHVGSATAHSRTAMAELTAANVLQFVRTGSLLTPIVATR